MYLYIHMYIYVYMYIYIYIYKHIPEFACLGTNLHNLGLGLIHSCIHSCVHMCEHLDGVLWCGSLEHVLH